MWFLVSCRTPIFASSSYPSCGAFLRVILIGFSYPNGLYDIILACILCDGRYRPFQVPPAAHNLVHSASGFLGSSQTHEHLLKEWSNAQNIGFRAINLIQKRTTLEFLSFAESYCIFQYLSFPMKRPKNT